MLGSAKELKGHTIQARDSDVGKVHEFYFDDASWKIRYLVADIGAWFEDYRVLIPPSVLGKPDRAEHFLPVDLTREHVENSPDAKTDKPVSIQKKGGIYSLTSLMIHWSYYQPAVILPQILPEAQERESPCGKPTDDPHLRSMRRVIGYHIRAADGEAGHVEDFIIDDEEWVIHYMAVGTRNWLPGKQVLVDVTCIEEISWSDSLVYVDLSRVRIKSSPTFKPSKPIDREYERKFYYLDRRKSR